MWVCERKSGFFSEEPALFMSKIAQIVGTTEACCDYICYPTD